MTEKANPSINRPASAFETAGAIAYGGHATNNTKGFVISGNDPTEIALQDGGIDDSLLDAFSESHSASSFNVTINPGEAFVFGSWLATDETYTVNLDVSTAGQTVYVGWNKDGTNDVLVGDQDTFSNASGNTDLKIPIWTFDTDGSGVTTATDERSIGYTLGSSNIDGSLDVFGDLDVDGATTLDGLTVAEAATFNSSLTANAPTTIDAELTIGGSTDGVEITTEDTLRGSTNNSAIRLLDDSTIKWTIFGNYDDNTFRIQEGGTQQLVINDGNGANEFLAGPLQANSFEDQSGNTMMDQVVSTGQVTLSSGSAVVDTGVSATDATFNLALGVDDPGADTKVSGRLFWDDSAGTYKIDIVETQTSIGNPTVNYDVIRVR